jgi:hypothetical protein
VGIKRDTDDDKPAYPHDRWVDAVPVNGGMINMEPATLADEKEYDPDSVGTR